VKRFHITTLSVVALCALSVCTLGLSCNDLLRVPQLRNADNNEIVNVGDSIFALSGDIYKVLESKAGETWRHYALSGSQMIGGLLGQPIPLQYEDARNDDPNIRVVYMDGGGNDVLLQFIAFDPYHCGQCNYWFCGDISRSCKNLIDDVAVEMSDLLATMAGDGVEQVVLLGYYHGKLGLLGNIPLLNKALDYGASLTIEAAENSNGFVEYVDPRNAFRGKEFWYILPDGVHPTYQGSKVLANMIWDVIDY
jgi:hypothetical protein